MLDARPEAILAILRSARSASPDPPLGEVLEAFRRQWLALARKRFPKLQDDVEDAVQSGSQSSSQERSWTARRTSPASSPWARSLFVHRVLDLARERGCRRTRRAYLASPDEYPEEVLRNGLPGDRPTPEEMTAYRERLEIVARCVETLDVARLNRGPAREGDRAAATSPSCRTEFSLTQILDRPLTGRVFFEEVIRRSRPPDQVQLLFQRRVTRRTLDRSRIRGHHSRSVSRPRAAGWWA